MGILRWIRELKIELTGGLALAFIINGLYGTGLMFIDLYRLLRHLIAR